MPLRLLQVCVPESDGEALDDLLEGVEVVARWPQAGAADRLTLQLLLEAEAVEPVMDRFEQKYSGEDGFHLVLFPVEAAVPRPDEGEADADAGGDGGEAEAEEDDRAGSVRVSREELYDDISEGLSTDRVFIAMTVLSTVVAAVGLMRDDLAVIIGAMVIAPLLGPNVGMSLATTLGDLELLRRALRSNLVGVALTLAASVAAGFVLTVDPEIPAIASRTRLGLSDLVLALAAGSAGTFAFTRGLAGPVIGVMVAVALVPPLTNFGILLGSGHFTPAVGALLLALANVICINLAGVATFLAQGVRPRTWWEEKRARKATRLAVAGWLLLLAALGAILYLTGGVRLAGPVG